MSVRTLRPLLYLPRTSSASSTSLSASSSCLSSSTTLRTSHQRTFLTSSPLAPTSQNLTATRTLHYPALSIYNLIADISSYPLYVPLCRSATITSLSRPDAHYHRRWPQRATLTIGYGDRITESFTSRVMCMPPVEGEMGRAGVGYVEAISGSEKFVREEMRRVMDGAGGEELAHHDLEISSTSSSTDGDSNAHSKSQSEQELEAHFGGPLEMLRTRWSVRGFPFKPAPPDGKRPQDGGTDGAPLPPPVDVTDVGLSIEFRFGNIAYDMMSRAVAPTLAEKMIEAFERRVDAVLGKERKR